MWPCLYKIEVTKRKTPLLSWSMTLIGVFLVPISVAVSHRKVWASSRLALHAFLQARVTGKASWVLPLHTVSQHLQWQGSLGTTRKGRINHAEDSPILHSVCTVLAQMPRETYAGIIGWLRWTSIPREKNHIIREWTSLSWIPMMLERTRGLSGVGGEKKPKLLLFIKHGKGRGNWDRRQRK